MSRQGSRGGLQVRMGGGPSTVSDFLQADFIDFLQVLNVPIVLGTDVRRGDHLTGWETRFSVESIISTSSALTHQLWNGNRRA